MIKWLKNRFKKEKIQYRTNRYIDNYAELVTFTLNILEEEDIPHTITGNQQKICVDSYCTFFIRSGQYRIEHSNKTKFGLTNMIEDYWIWKNLAV